MSTDPTKTDETNETPTPDASNNGSSAPDAGTDAADDAPESKIESLTSEIEALEAEREEINERLLRKAAEFENYRRRTEREKRRRFTSGKIEVLRSMLDVLDDFERSIDAAEDLQETQDAETAYESLKGGVEMVFRKFQDTLASLGVEPIDAEGESFDESLHEAMMRQPASGDASPGDVLQVIRKGYVMGDRVLRHSRVIVASEPSDD